MKEYKLVDEYLHTPLFPQEKLKALFVTHFSHKCINSLPNYLNDGICVRSFDSGLVLHIDSLDSDSGFAFLNENIHRLCTFG